MPSQDYASLQEGPPSLPQPATAATAPAQQREEKCGLKFDDPRLAFAAHSNAQLLRGVAVFGLCSLRPLVRHAESGLRAAKRVLGRPVVNATIRHTFFKHFCAGGFRVCQHHAEMPLSALCVLSSGVHAKDVLLSTARLPCTALNAAACASWPLMSHLLQYGVRAQDSGSEAGSRYRIVTVHLLSALCIARRGWADHQADAGVPAQQRHRGPRGLLRRKRRRGRHAVFFAHFPRSCSVFAHARSCVVVPSARG